MNILFVVGMFARNEKDSALSGMPYAVYKSALGMKEIGHEVRILSVASEDKIWTYRGIEVTAVRAEHGLEAGSELPGILKSLYCIINREYKLRKKILNLHKEKTIDIIQYGGWFGIGLLHPSKIPGIMRISTYTKVQLVNNFEKKKKKLLETAEYLAAKRMNFVFAPSRVMAQGVEKDIKRKTAVIETPYLQEEIKWNDRIVRLKLKDKRYLLFFGRMSVDKGILVIKEILYKTLEKYSEIYFVFAGNSWMHNGIMIEKELLNEAKGYKERVVFLGQLSKDLLMPVVQNAEMILMPSLADNFPNSCAEAMALGKIVIGTDGSSLEQFIENDRNGFLAEIGDSNSLFNCLEYVMRLNIKQKMLISENARERIKNLNLREYSENMERIYIKLI